MTTVQNVTSFKATAAQIAQQPAGQSQRYYRPQVSPEQYAMIQAQKKADSHEKWNKAGIIAQIGLAVAFGVIAITGLFTHKAQKGMFKAQAEYFKSQTRKPVKAQNLVDEFVDLSKNSKIVSKDDKSIKKDSVVEILAIEGVKLKVKEKKESEE